MSDRVLAHLLSPIVERVRFLRENENFDKWSDDAKLGAGLTAKDARAVEEAYFRLLAAHPSLDEKFNKLLSLLPNWDSYGAPSIIPSVLSEARAWLDSVHVVPCSDGGVQLEWHRNDVDVEVTFSREAAVEAWARDGGDSAR